MVDALSELNDFRRSPFYTYYTQLLQASADAATIKVFEPLTSEDPYAREHREQLMGAAVAFLKFQQIVDFDLTSLQTKLIEQQEQNGQS